MALGILGGREGLWLVGNGPSSHSLCCEILFERAYPSPKVPIVLHFFVVDALCFRAVDVEAYLSCSCLQLTEQLLSRLRAVRECCNVICVVQVCYGIMVFTHLIRTRRRSEAPARAREVEKATLTAAVMSISGGMRLTCWLDR